MSLNANRGPEAPDVSVLMAVHNGERHLEASLRSVMEQSLRNIEIVVVDDASTDGSPDMLARLAREDARIRVLRCDTNLRLAGALNHGLDHVRAPLVARMDDDDLAYPRRLEVQKAYMDAHPGTTLAGTSVDWLDDDGARTRQSVRSRDSFAIRWTCRFALNITHPTFMFRRTLPSGDAVRYDPEMFVAQDYDLVCRLLSAGGEVVCLPDVLLAFRRHGGSISRTKGGEQLRLAKRICRDFQDRELPPGLFEKLAPMRDAFYDMASLEADAVRDVFDAARRMLDHDMATYPGRVAWLRRQTAQYVFWTLQRCRMPDSRIAAAFARHAPGWLPALGMRMLETRRMLPAALHTDPPVWLKSTSPR